MKRKTTACRHVPKKLCSPDCIYKTLGIRYLFRMQAPSRLHWLCLSRKGRFLIKNRLWFAPCSCFYDSWPCDLENSPFILYAALDHWEWWFLWLTDKKWELWVFTPPSCSIWNEEQPWQAISPSHVCSVHISRLLGVKLNHNLYAVVTVSKDLLYRSCQSIWFMIYAIMHNDVYVECKSSL